MYCGNCGNQLQDGSRFCPYCGAATGAAPSGMGESPIPTGTAAPGRPGRGRKLALVLIAVAVVVLGAVLALVLLGGRGSLPGAAKEEYTLEECGYLPLYCGDTSGYLMVNVNEKTILPGQAGVGAYLYSYAQWNAPGSRPAFCLMGDSVTESYWIMDYYDADGHLLGRSYEPDTRSITDGNGYAVIHTKPNDWGEYWSIVIDENGNVIREVSSEEYGLWSWDPKGYSVFSQNDLYGLLGPDGTVEIEAKYSNIQVTQDGWIVVEGQERGIYYTRLLDDACREQESFEDMRLERCHEGLLCLRSDITGEYVLMDLKKNGQELRTTDYLVSESRFSDGTVLICCQDSDGYYYLLNMDGEVVQKDDPEGDGGSYYSFTGADTIIINNWQTYTCGIYDSRLQPVFDGAYSRLSSILDGAYYNACWEEYGVEYSGLLDREGEICVYYTEGTSEPANAGGAENCAADYTVVYDQEGVYQPGGSAWATVQAGLRAIANGESGQAVEAFLELPDGTFGWYGTAEELEETLQYSVEWRQEEYGQHYRITIYPTVYEDVTEDYAAEIEAALDGSGQEVETVLELRVTYLIDGELQSDNVNDLEYNESGVPVVCVDGVWYLCLWY